MFYVFVFRFSITMKFGKLNSQWKSEYTTTLTLQIPLPLFCSLMLPPFREPSSYMTNSLTFEFLFLTYDSFSFLKRLFYSPIGFAREMLASEKGSNKLVRTVNNRLSALS